MSATVGGRPTVTVVIPARMSSTRYPGKPLAAILGLPMIEHVRRRIMLAGGVDSVVVATPDTAIMDVVAAAGGIGAMTKHSHVRCTERVVEAMEQRTADIVVIVQGDEPLVVPEVVQEVVRPLLEDPSLECTNLLCPLESAADRESPEVVKAACDLQGNVLFFTRSSIPCFRDKVEVPVYRQTGIMAFRSAFLKQYDAWSETPLEKAESVDMLRILEHGHRIRGVVTNFIMLGVDRPSDVPTAERILRDDPAQHAIYESTLSMSSAKSAS